MRLLAISDLHLDFCTNHDALEALPHYPDDWIVIAGDVAHDPRHFEFALSVLASRFRRVVWAPGNHDLWTTSPAPAALKGEAKYQALVALCRARGVLTPEDPYPEIHLGDATYVIAPLFLLYDYSFRPEAVAFERAVEWAAEANVCCADERLLHATPHASRAAWCQAQCAATEARLAAVPREHRLVLVNHFPLREDLVYTAMPRFRIWCGTRRTEDWHRRFNVAVVVSGHLHVRTTTVVDQVRFEEVSLGYPYEWPREHGIARYVRQILPEPDGE